MHVDNYVTKYVHTCTFEQEVSNMKLKEWLINLYEDLLYFNSKHSRKGDIQLDMLEGDIGVLKREIQNIRETNELLTNRTDNLTSVLEAQSLTMKGYFSKQTGIDNTSNLNTSNDKELIDLTEKNIITNKLTLNHLIENSKKGSGLVNIFDEVTSSGTAENHYK